MPTKINFHPKFSHQNKYRYNHACTRSIDCDILGSAFIDISDFAHTFILSIRGYSFCVGMGILWESGGKAGFEGGWASIIGV